MVVALSLFAGILGVIVGAMLARRNARKGHADTLLCDALDDLISAIAEAAGDKAAQPRYASAVSRVALHGSPKVVEAFRAFQEDANTGTQEADAGRGFEWRTRRTRTEGGCCGCGGDTPLRTLLASIAEGTWLNLNLASSTKPATFEIPPTGFEPVPPP